MIRIIKLLFQREKLIKFVELAHDAIDFVLRYAKDDSDFMKKVVSLLTSLRGVIRYFGENFLGIEFKAIKSIEAASLDQEHQLSDIMKRLENFKQEIK